ncbi:MAG: DUF4174 domain-containing protein [Candidatus Marinimicrobia bacterium]|nr:DUF4174 domain-containing protein [Candidatus Neomarinimicrobiota bacterium]
MFGRIRRQLLIGISTILLIPVFTLKLSGEEPMNISMDDFLWENRPILIFVESPENANYQALTQQIEQERAGIKDRDIVILHLISKGQSFLGDRPISKESARNIRQRFQPNSEVMTVVLVGKDGTEKARKTGLIDITTFFPIIDAMPMRQREMRQQNK